ncbi:MAG: fumarylacetoacetate hydrolase family protein [Crocinitomicaceae bacterium]|nr:fumarylacetoacetate hydrolase family protein [Crocinitomicaceae bacterium]
MKIICIGRNYSEHAKELGNKIPDVPVFFCKPDSAVLPKGTPFFIPDWSANIQFEVELVYRIHRLGKNIEYRFAPRYYAEVGLGIDFTARDIQERQKRNGLPWELAKAFDGSAVISQEFISLEDISDRTNIRFSLKKNNQTVQSGHSAGMIFSIDRIIEYISKYMTLKMGDLIFTGTPAGVGPVAVGVVLEGYIEEKKMFRVNIR